jgi:predicted transcriptional regulator YdeE
MRHYDGGMNHKPKLIQVPAFRLMGLATRTTNALEMNSAIARIPTIWQRFFAENVGAAIPHRTHPQNLLGVYTNYVSDHTGEYSMMVAAEVNKPAQQAGLTHLHVPAATYLVFSASGAMPQTVVETWQRVWAYFTPSAAHQRAYTVDFERYDAARPDFIEIYIAIKD